MTGAWSDVNGRIPAQVLRDRDVRARAGKSAAKPVGDLGETGQRRVRVEVVGIVRGAAEQHLAGRALDEQRQEREAVAVLALGREQRRVPRRQVAEQRVLLGGVRAVDERLDPERPCGTVLTQLEPLPADRDVDAVAGEERRAPGAGRDDDRVGR